MISAQRYRWTRPIYCKPWLLTVERTALNRRPGRVYLKGCREAEMFSRYLPRPNTTLFVVTGSSVHNAMPIFVPDRSIFIVKAGRAFSYGRERRCSLKRNIPRKIKSASYLWLMCS